jgi:hypothetical protein
MMHNNQFHVLLHLDVKKVMKELLTITNTHSVKNTNYWGKNLMYKKLLNHLTLFGKTDNSPGKQDCGRKLWLL